MEIYEILDRFEILYPTNTKISDLRRSYNDKDISSMFRLLPDQINVLVLYNLTMLPLLIEMIFFVVISRLYSSCRELAVHGTLVGNCVLGLS